MLASRKFALASFVLLSCSTPEPTRGSDTTANDTTDPSAPPKAPSTNDGGTSGDAAEPESGAADAASSKPGDCTANGLLAERVGFGAQTKGGDPSVVYHVTTLA